MHRTTMRDRTTRALGLALATLLALPCSTRAQQPAAPACAPAAATDSVTRWLALRLSAVDSTQGLDERWRRDAEIAVAERLQLPALLPLAAYIVPRGDTLEPADFGARAAGAPAAPRQAHRTLDGLWLVTLHDDGRVDSPLVVASTLVPALDSAMLAALVVLGDSILPAPRWERGRMLALRLRLSLVSERDRSGTRLGVLRLATYRVTRDVVPVPGNRAPRYPDARRIRWEEGDVRLRFVVDDAGWPIVRTIREQQATHPDFLRSTLDALPHWRFFPAEVEGCRVPMLVDMPFQFRLSR
jgi:TonB family protein